MCVPVCMCLFLVLEEKTVADSVVGNENSLYVYGWVKKKHPRLLINSCLLQYSVCVGICEIVGSRQQTKKERPHKKKKITNVHTHAHI